VKNYKGIFWKVVLGFTITAFLLAMAYWITYDNLNTLKNNLSTLSKPNPKYSERKLVVSKINETEMYVKRYTINKNREYLYKCDSCMNVLGEKMYELKRMAINNPSYDEGLNRLSRHINEKLSIARQRIELANAFSSGKEMSAAIDRIVIPEKKTILPEIEERKEPTEKKSFFSRFFTREKNKVKKADTVPVTAQEDASVTAGYLKEMLHQAELKETEKSNQYLRESLSLISKDDRLQDSISQVSDSLEKMEMEEALAGINKLTEEATNKTANILSSLIIIGLLVMLLFVVVVYREVRFNERLRKELIREKKNTEKLAKAKEEFLANMSHEIRTPMNVITGFTDQLLKTDLSSDQQKFLLNIKRSSKHLLTVINEILDYSKMESGVITLESIPFSVKEVMDDVYEAFKGVAEKKDISLRFTIDEPVKNKVIGDPVRLKQILLNLTGNAIKFTSKGSVEVRCKLWEAEEERQTLLIEVEDTGIGIPAEAHAIIFEQFTQADTSVTRKYGGTGLGLAISKKLVELHKGEIAVKSEPGKGSMFYFTISYYLPASENEDHLHVAEVKNTARLRGKRILIADDDEMNKFLAQHILAAFETDIDTAANGREALEKAVNEYFDVVLMDLHMPEMSGMDVVAAIRKKGIDVPVIAVTGNVLGTEREKCLKAGMNEYISKPYEENELLQKVIDQLPTV
jgi:signal transduction histidine kinase